ncbi:hypothetical protein EYC80_009781 [Monilinia laxa]|uniref:Uncharacterized protein n=1 Tax=Monilinia laxa TaxID=61186 RepID=A0A5N6JQM9_MONLA|nr:hypothetical protein EYC80_009781 [Monilinia laxa]
MNAQSILIPGPPQPLDLQAPDKQDNPGFNTLLDMPHWRGIASTTICPDESLDLGALARIWFLADYLMIPHVQNMAINLMYRRLLPQGSPLCYFGELSDAAGVALGIDGTLVKEENEVQKLLENYLAYCSSFDEWTLEQRAMIPKEIKDGAMVCLRKCARAQEWCESTHMRDIMEGKMESVGYFFVEDELDGGKADSGLDPEFHYLRVLEW